jgi:adenylosuccinate synthase
MPKAFVTVDLGFGDAGKGTIVDSLVRRHGLAAGNSVPMVVRFSGGCQCAHNVVTKEGIHHTFSQFGSGALAGAATLLTKDVLIDPYRLVNEYEVLQSKGVRPIVYVDENALIITPFHAALNRIKETARATGGHRHGSCGVGIGEAAEYALEHPDGALRVKDLKHFRLTRDKLTQIMIDLTSKSFAYSISEEHSVFSSPFLIEALLWRYHRFASVVHSILTAEEVLDIISSLNTVWEGSQGILIDEDYGLHPHTTWSRVTLRNAAETLKAAGVTDVTNIGILRAYGCRHGPGPFPTEDSNLGMLLPEPHNETNPWQQHFRRGWFDLTLAKYALKVSGGTDKAVHMQPCPIDQLAITHLDSVQRLSAWKAVTDYGLSLEEIPSPEDWSKRERLTSCLSSVTESDWKTEDIPYHEAPCWMSEKLNTQVGIASFGPAYSDKKFLL